jgi:Na+/H+ antiporter NhaB
MNKFDEALEMSDEKFLRRFGYSKKTMKKMVEILQKAYNAKHKRRGRHSKLKVAEMLIGM